MLCNLPINIITARVHELLKSSRLKVDGVKDGRELVTLNAEQMPERANVATAPSSLPVEICAAPNTTAPESNDRTRVFSSVVAVVPYCGYKWWEMSEQSARAIVADGKRNGMYEYAEKRLGYSTES